MQVHNISLDGEDTSEYIHLYNVPTMESLSEYIPSTEGQQDNYCVGNSPPARGCTLGVTWVFKLKEEVNPHGEHFDVKG